MTLRHRVVRIPPLSEQLEAFELEHAMAVWSDCGGPPARRVCTDEHELDESAAEGEA